MSEWSSGYVTDAGYTYGYYPELNPVRARLALTMASVAAPEIRNACELGFGQGVSLNIHATAAGARWYGNDFNPAHAAYARNLANTVGNEAVVLDDSFEEFLQRDDLPEFDYIGLHGIWTWVSHENRARLVEIIRRRLRVGGIVYMSYNALPGWAAASPLRHLIAEHGSGASRRDPPTPDRALAAVEFAGEVLNLSKLWSEATPSLKGRIERLKKHDKRYLAHEYMNRDWHPMYFADVARLLGDAKLEFAASASFPEISSRLGLSQEQRDFLDKISDAVHRESVRDFFVNQQFRRDYWVKGAHRLNRAERNERLRQFSIILTGDPAGDPPKLRSGGTDISLKADVYQPILALLTDRKPHSLGDIERELSAKDVSMEVITLATQVLIGGSLAGVVADAPSDTTLERCRRFNRQVLERSHLDGEIMQLASPVIGGAVSATRAQQFFLKRCLEGEVPGATRPTIEDLAVAAWKGFRILGQRLIRDGKTLESDEDNLQELRTQAEKFLRVTMPNWRALRIVETAASAAPTS